LIEEYQFSLAAELDGCGFLKRLGRWEICRLRHGRADVNLVKSK